MPRIRVLPDLLVNKIAAGEVIERPASVVKELVENSIDAGARSVEIAVEQGGQKLIRVTDDGGGMDADDLALSVRPHATSKIACEEDLFAIRTMGFRGEALASIGAVSQLRVISRRPGCDEARQVTVCGERADPPAAASAPPGTTVEVRELFFNVPARRKFLRTPQTELGHITEQLARIALVHHGVQFRLTHNGREVHFLRPAAGMLPRIRDFFGPELAEGLMALARDERGLRITGYAGEPAQSRSAPKWQYFFLNGRFIRDRFIAHAVREAYRGLIEPSRHPVVFLALEIDPACVDVNVHPTKAEVRWRDSNLLYSQVLSVLRDRFLNTDLTPDLAGRSDLQPALGDDAPATADGAVHDAADEARRQRIRESIADFFKRTGPAAGPGFGPPGARRSPGPQGAGSALSPWPRLEPWNPPAEADPGEPPDRPLWDPPARGNPPADAGATSGPPPRAIQVHRTYLVAESPEGLMIIDQHALHERILYEQLSVELARGPLESQRLLLPETLSAPADQVAVIEQYADTLRRLGVELSAYGPGAVAVHAVPSLLRPERSLEFVRDLLDRLAHRAAPASCELLIDELLSMMACKAAVKAGDPLTPQEIEALLARRGDVERASNCPHGRPTSLRLTLRDLEKQFKRV